MLTELHLRGLGVITEARVPFAPGLNVVTGETGVGKTLLVSSLALVTGSRASARLVAQGASEASVEAVLDAASLPAPAARRLSELGVDPDDDLVLARRVGADGRSRAWLAGRLVPASVLGELDLIEIHGQGAGFALARPAAQLEAIDAMGANEELLRAYREVRDELQSLRTEQARLETGEQDAARERELLSFQVAEIERAELDPGELDELETELSRLEHAERLAEVAVGALDRIGTEGAAGALSEAERALEGATKLDPALGPLVARLARVAAEAAEVAWDLRSWAEDLDGDPGRLEGVRERRALIASLQRKYGGTVAEILEVAERGRRRLAEIEMGGDRLAELAGRIERARAEADRLAADLSQRRASAAGDLSALVAAELPALALPDAVFEVVCRPADRPTASGRDSVAFRFSASRRRTPSEIGALASGGELSRAMIAVTLALAHRHAVPVLVFDEADQGIGGQAALELARRLARLGRSHQVLVVSHLPQLAAFADHHLVVTSEGGEVGVEAVAGRQRTAEVSRMLAGVSSSSHAKRHAAELMELAAAERADAAASRAS